MGRGPVRVEEFCKLKPPDHESSKTKWSREKLCAVKELFTDFVRNTLYAEAPVIMVGEDEEGGGGAAIEENEEEKCPDVLKVSVGTMVKVTNMDHDEEAAEGPGNRKWFLGEVVEMCEEDGDEWMNVHLWRSYGRGGDPGRIYFPVWASPDGEREVYMRNPKAAGGIRGAERWTHWYTSREMATLAVATCEEMGKGLRVKAWRLDYEF